MPYRHFTPVFFTALTTAFFTALPRLCVRPSVPSAAPAARGQRLGFTSWLVALAMLAGLGVAGQTFAQNNGLPQTELPRIKLGAGMHRIEVQVASTFEERGIGLMYRQDMPQHEGMLFVFEQPAQQCFWMKNTLIPLTAAFVANDGRIVNLVNMQPQTLASHCSKEPVRFVLEMNQGWFEKKALRAGSYLTGAPFKR